MQECTNQEMCHNLVRRNSFRLNHVESMCSAALSNSSRAKPGLGPTRLDKFDWTVQLSDDMLVPGKHGEEVVSPQRMRQIFFNSSDAYAELAHAFLYTTSVHD